MFNNCSKNIKLIWSFDDTLTHEIFLKKICSILRIIRGHMKRHIIRWKSNITNIHKSSKIENKLKRVLTYAQIINLHINLLQSKNIWNLFRIILLHMKGSILPFNKPILSQRYDMYQFSYKIIWLKAFWLQCSLALKIENLTNLENAQSVKKRYYDNWILVIWFNSIWVKLNFSVKRLLVLQIQSIFRVGI